MTWRATATSTAHAHAHADRTGAGIPLPRPPGPTHMVCTGRDSVEGTLGDIGHVIRHAVVSPPRHVFPTILAVAGHAGGGEEALVNTVQTSFRRIFLAIGTASSPLLLLLLLFPVLLLMLPVLLLVLLLTGRHMGHGHGSAPVCMPAFRLWAWLRVLMLHVVERAPPHLPLQGTHTLVVGHAPWNS